MKVNNTGLRDYVDQHEEWGTPARNEVGSAPFSGVLRVLISWKHTCEYWKMLWEVKPRGAS